MCRTSSALSWPFNLLIRMERSIYKTRDKGMECGEQCRDATVNLGTTAVQTLININGNHQCQWQ